MTAGVTTRAATALRWRATQLAGVQGIYLLRLLIMAKLLAPDAFGLLAIASIAVSVLMRLSDFGMIPALIQRAEATPEQFDAAWTVGLTRAALITLALVLAAPLVALLFNEPRATPIIQVLALRPLIEAGTSIGVARLNRELRFRELALIYLPAAIVDMATAVLLAPGLGVWALVAGALAGSAAMVTASYILAPHRPRLVFRWQAIEPLMNYGRWILAQGIVLLAGTFAIQLAISRMLGAAALGLFFLAVKVAFLPVEAASAVVGSVAFPMFAGLRGDVAGTSRSFATLLAALVLILVPVYTLMFVLAPMFEQALGGRWIGTAPIVRILAVAGVAAILSDLMGPLLMGLGRADRAFMTEGLQTAVVLTVLLPAIAFFGLAGAATAWLVGISATIVLGVIWARQVAPGAFRQAGPRLVAASIAGLAAGLAAAAVSWWLSGWAGLIAGGIAGVLAAAVLLWWLDSRIGLRLSEFGALLRRAGASQQPIDEAPGT